MKIIDISTRRRVTIAMFTLAVVLFGVVSFLRLREQLCRELCASSISVSDVVKVQRQKSSDLIAGFVSVVESERLGDARDF